jgi:acetolactate synthase-1/2/3 large subunit
LQAPPRSTRSADYPSQAEFGSDYIVEIMQALGIEYAAFNPGATFRGLHDSIVNFQGGSGIQVVECTHEEISVAIAHGYARAAGKPMAAIVHDVVGLQHATMAIFNAWVDRVPVFVIGATGPMDSTRRRPRIDWIHTANVQGLQVRDYVKLDDQPASIRAVPESMLRGWRTMLAEPQGPVYICFDSELQEDHAPSGLIVQDVDKLVRTTRIAPDPKAIEQIARMLLAAENPVIMTGYFGHNPVAVPSLAELAELVGCRVLPSDERFSIATTHPLNLLGAEKQVLGEADFVLTLDVWDLLGRMTTLNRLTRTTQSMLAPNAKVATIGLSDLIVRSWTQDFLALYPAELHVVADTSVAVPMLVDAVHRLATSSNGEVAARRGAAIRAQHDAIRAGWRDRATDEARNSPISVAYLSQQLGAKVQGRGWVLANHSFNPWPMRLWNLETSDQYASGPNGSGVGYGLGGTIGTALAHRGNGKVILDIQADGDLLMCTSALWTMAQQRLPILMVMQNNRSYYNSEEHALSMAEYRGRPADRAGIGTRIVDPAVDFGKVARGFGIYGEGPVTEPAELGPAIERALRVVTEEGTPALVDVVTAPR